MFLRSRKEVKALGAKERILTIRLMEKVNANPVLAKAFGIVAVNEPSAPQRKTASNPVNRCE